MSYQGRKSGRWHSLPCIYARHGQDLYIIPGHPDRKVWWRNLRQPTPVRLETNGTVMASRPLVVVTVHLDRS